MMKKIYIQRKYRSFGILSKFKVYLNSEFKGIVLNGEKIEINHDEKHIELLIKNSYFWRKKIVIDNPNTIEKFETSYSCSDTIFWFFGIILFFLAVLFFLFKNIYIHYILIFSLLVFVYFFSIKKDRIYINRLK